MNKICKMFSLLEIDTIPQLIMRLFSTWILTAFVMTFGVTDFLTLPFITELNIIKYIALFTIIFALFSMIRIGWELCKEEHFLLGSTLLYGIRSLSHNTDVYFLFGICFFFFMIYCYCYKSIANTTLAIHLSRKQLRNFCALLIFLCTGFVGGITIIRYLSSSSSNFDMGIFVQTFYNLKEHFTLDNTCERNMAISHLQVHTSLIYYLFFPIYYLFPCGETLLILQALSVASGVIPLALLAKHYNLTKKLTGALCLIYVLSPAAIGGCFYDFHENVFLLPLLLWLFYCSERGHWPLTFLLGFLTCTVKEDATLFVLVFGIYLLLCRGKEKGKVGLGLIAMSLIYMACAFYYLSHYGLGLMTYRFSNIMSSDSLLSIFKTFLTNPAYLFTQVFNADKWGFTIVVILPTAGILFYTKKYKNLLLLIPFLFVNLLPDYVYMHSVFFQYVFAPFAFIMYLVVINLSMLKPALRKKLVLLGMVFAIFTFSSQVWEKTSYIKSYRENTETRNTITETLATIPDTASVTTSTFFLPQLANREVIYMISESEVANNITYDTDYVLFDLRPGYCDMEFINTVTSLYESMGYTQDIRVENVILTMRKAL